ncbi:MAG: DUF615 domain-containing protein [Burkholderiaceae bacterium]|nr:DUF615 domain-containing protein [Burkholderiaceae bacterium]
MISDRLNQQYEEDDEFLGPSKSEKKRMAEHMQALGKELTELGEETLAKVNLPDEIMGQIKEFHRLKSFGAKRRQLQLIGKYMRALDAEAVRTAIDRATGQDRASVAALHKAENLRDQLIADDSTLSDFIKLFPEVDIQQVRQLIRTARKEKESNKPPKASRELYRLIYALVLPPLNFYADEQNDE